MVEVGRKSEVSAFAVNFSRRGEFVVRTIVGETVLVPVRGQAGDLDAIYTFNELGSFIWALLDGKRSVTEIVREICEQFDAAIENVEHDTIQLLATLQGWGIVEASSERNS